MQMFETNRFEFVPFRYLRSTAATSTKTSPRILPLLCTNYFGIIPSYSRRSIWAKYPKIKLVRVVLELKKKSERFVFARSRCS